MMTYRKHGFLDNWPVSDALQRIIDEVLLFLFTNRKHNPNKFPNLMSCTAISQSSTICKQLCVAIVAQKSLAKDKCVKYNITCTRDDFYFPSLRVVCPDQVVYEGPVDTGEAHAPVKLGISSQLIL